MEENTTLVQSTTENVYKLPLYNSQLTPKAQERVSLAPRIQCSLNDEEIIELRTILTKKDLINNVKLITKLGDFKVPETEKVEISQNIQEAQKLCDDFHNKLDLLLISEERAQKLNNLRNDITEKKSLVQNFNVILDEQILVYRKAQALQQFAENELLKNESDKLFIYIKDKYQNYVNRLADGINQSVEKLEELSQKQTSDK